MTKRSCFVALLVVGCGGAEKGGVTAPKQDAAAVQAAVTQDVQAMYA